MGYLIAEILVSLLIAAGIGFALGWVCRGALAPPETGEEPEVVKPMASAARPGARPDTHPDAQRDPEKKKAKAS